MADSNNPGQFGNRDDTEEQAREGGKTSSGSFGEENSADPHDAGKRGAEAQPVEAKQKGGEIGGQQSSRGSSDDNDNDDSDNE